MRWYLEPLRDFWEVKRWGSHRISAGRESGISGQSSGELPLWKTSWAKNWENLLPVLQVIEGVITAWVPGSDAAPWSMVRIEEKIYAL